MTEIPPQPPAIHRQNQTAVPLSFAQEGMWFLQQLDPENNAYNTNFVYQFHGGVDPQAMEQALNEIIRRHESLRTLYPNEHGKPVQRIQPYEPLALQVIDLTNLEEKVRSKIMQTRISELGIPPYDLQRGPLIRCALLHLEAEKDVLFFGTHHINTDAWSRQVFLSELLQIYAELRSGSVPALPEPAIQYADYAVWQREWLQGKPLAAFTDHWQKMLSGDLPLLDLPADFPRPEVQTYHGRRHRFTFSPDFLAQLKDFCRRERITLFHLFLAAYAVLLMRHSGQEDIIVGCPFANRPLAELEKSIGVFVNTLPIRLNLSGNPTTRSLLTQVRERMLDAFTWQAVPFELLVAAIAPERDLSRTPVFQVAINMRNIPHTFQPNLPGLEVETLTVEDAPAPFDLSLEFDPLGDSWLPSIQYNADLFSENSILHLKAHFQTLLHEILIKTEQPVSELHMLTDSERQRILFDWNRTEAEFPQVCLQDLVSAQAARTPDAPAVICNGDVLTYAALERRSNQLAHHLRQLGVGAGTRSAVFLPRSALSVVSLLAILKAGGTYLPLDITYPVERLADLLEDAQPAAVITLAGMQSALPEGQKVICLDREADRIEACPTTAPAAAVDNEAPAYMIYTSGSTGRPKGVINSHRGVVNFLAHIIRQLDFAASDSVIHLTSFSFDISLYDLFGMLAVGGTVHLLDDNQMRDPEFINQVIASRPVTVISLVPTMLRAISTAALEQSNQANSLRLILPAGEALQRSDVELARRAYGASLGVVNQYGPTECSIIQTNYEVPLDLRDVPPAVPIGKPVSNVYTYVLDQYLAPVPVGSKGELFIGGVAVGLGYWNRPELTDARFLPDPFHPGGKMYRSGDVVRQLPDGTICYLGRSDNQVKIRGYRVELGEIEAVIKTFPAVQNAVVTLWREKNDPSLAAYVTFATDGAGNIEDLRQFLAAHLPFYMLPSSITLLQEIPLLANGKVNRLALPQPAALQKKSDYIAPRNEIEERLTRLWEEVLGVHPISVRDNFFELGGHSLMAVQLFSLIQKEFAQTLPLLTLFRESTIEALAAALYDQRRMVSPGIIPISTEGDAPPLYILPAGLNIGHLAFALGSARPVYALYPMENGYVVHRDSIEATAGIYYKCLTDFDPQGPYLLMGHSADGLYALELARLLRSHGREVAFLGLLDTTLPKSLRRVNQRERLQAYRKDLKKLSLPGKVDYLKNKVLRKTLEVSRDWKDLRSPKADQGEENVMEINRRLQSVYRPQPYAGDAVYFSATERVAYTHSDERWAELIQGRFQVVPVPGGHHSVLEPPYVDVLAEKILAVLNQNEPG